MESRNPDGVEAGYYGPDEQIHRVGRMRVSFKVRDVRARNCQHYLDGFFDITGIAGSRS